MSDKRGTLEAIIGELTILLAPLTDLAPAGAPGLVLQLGLPMTPAQATQIAAPLSKTTSAIGTLIDVGPKLEKAIEDEDWSTVLSKGISAIDAIGKLISGLTQLGSALGGLNLPGVTPAVIAQIPERIMSWLLVGYFSRSPGLNELLQLAGLLVRTDHNLGSHDPTQPFFTTNAFDFGRVGGWLTKPSDQLAQLYDWGKPTFGIKLFTLLDRLFGEAGFPTLFDPASPNPALDLLFAQLTVHPPGGNKPPGLEVHLRDGLGKGSFQVGASNFTLTLGVDAEVPMGTALVVVPDAITLKLPDATQLSGKLRGDLAYKRPDGPLRLLSIAGGSVLQVGSVSAYAEIAAKPSGATLDLGADLKGGKVVISTENVDGFLGTILGGIHLENDFDLGIAYSTDEGLHFHGSSTLEIQLASHISLGPVDLTKLTLSLGVKGSEFPIGITTDLSATIGPLYAEVDGIGVSANFKLVSGNSGNLGPVDLSIGFQPPNGVALSIDAGVVSGGGYLYLNPDKGEYAGALELNIADIVDAKAIGLINTILPDGSKGFSLLIIISAEFSPPFQLGYGFTLVGVGGLLGLNRTVVLEALRDGVRTNAIASVMFPKDVIKNAQKIISDLRQIFPPKKDIFLIGPMAKLGWGTPTLVSLSFGLIIEIPGNLAILGILRIALPTEDTALINLQINFVGTLDFDKKLLAFDASLYDSHILFITLEGDMAVRLKWGRDDAGFLVSIGGFHPSYQPPAGLEVKPMKRLAVSILDTDWAKIRIECYFAVTSNTVQMGAHAELYFGFSAFNIQGHIGFDALIQFSPFYFTVAISAGLSIHVFGLDLLSIQLDFQLSGPTPWHIAGSGSIHILFFTIHADFDTTWGDSAQTTLPPVAVLPLLLDQLKKTANWEALPPASHHLYVTLAKLDEPDGTLVLHPAGALRVRQRVAPLDLTWQRLGQQKPSDIERASFTAAKSGALDLAIDPVDDDFARSHYQDLTDAEKLSAPDFQKFHAGAVVRLGSDLATGAAVTRHVEYELTLIDKEPQSPRRVHAIRSLHGRQLRGNAVARSPGSLASKNQRNPFASDPVNPPTERFAIVSVTDNRLHAGTAPTSYAMAQDALVRLVAKQPSLARQLHVVPVFEVNAA